MLPTRDLVREGGLWAVVAANSFARTSIIKGSSTRHASHPKETEAVRHSMSSLHPLIEKRRSLRAIDPNRPVPPEVIETLLEAARWAPSSGNAQPWRFVVVSAPDALQRAREALRPGNQTWASRAPVLFAICANPED